MPYKGACDWMDVVGINMTKNNGNISRGVLETCLKLL
jgi:hypothetical protein